MAQFLSKPFGMTPNGEKINEYIISNPGGLAVSVLNYGCIIKNIWVPTKCGPVDVVLGHDTYADYVKDFESSGSTCCGAFVGRYANRIENAVFNVGGKPYQLDANTGIQAAFDNLLVLYSASTPRDDGRTLDYDLTMGGGLWLNGGHLWHITWTQGTGSTFAFYDADGRPLRILSGRSYIAWLSSLTGEEVTVQDSAGNDLLQP